MRILHQLRDPMLLVALITVGVGILFAVGVLTFRAPPERPVPSSFEYSMTDQERKARTEARKPQGADALDSKRVEPDGAFSEVDASDATHTVDTRDASSSSDGASFEDVRATLADAIAAHLPELAPSAQELDQLADATLRLRSAQAALRTIPKNREQAFRRENIRERLEAAIEDFQYVARMDPAEFTRRVQQEAGTDVPSGSEAGGEILIRPIRVQDRFE